jgi:hypothetical protein
VKINPPSTTQPDGFEILSRLNLLKGIALNQSSLDSNIDIHVARSFFEMRALDYATLDIVDDYSNNTCYYTGTLDRNFASAFLYDETSNQGLGIDWVSRSSATDYDMPWGGKNLLAGDREKFRIRLFASDGDPERKNKPYSFEGQNVYTPGGKWCCSELPLLNALDCIANGLGFISGPEDLTNKSCFVMMTERITCDSCRQNIVKFLQKNHIKKLRLYYMFDSVIEENYEDLTTLLSHFHRNNIDAVIARVKFIRGVDKEFYKNTPHAVQFRADFNPRNEPDAHVYASMSIRSMEGNKVITSDYQYKFHPDQTDAYYVHLDPNLDEMSQTVDFFENEFFANHKYSLFNKPDKPRKNSGDFPSYCGNCLQSAK